MGATPMAPAGLVGLQRAAGNGAVAALLSGRPRSGPPGPVLQRQHATKPDQRAKIEKALNGRDWSLIAEIDDLGQATDEEKVKLSSLAIVAGFRAPEAATAKVHQLWALMADRLGVVVGSHQQQWDDAVKFSPRLLTLQPVVDAQNDFKATLRSIADANLTANRNFVTERKKTLGIDAESPLSAQQRTELRRSIQSMAWSTSELRREQAGYRKMVVGYDHSNLGFGEGEWHFDPGHPPKVRSTMFSTPRHRHEDVLEAWTEAENQITDVGNDYPEIYAAAMADEDGAALLALSRVIPETFAENAKQHLLELDNRIKTVQDMIADGRLDLLDLGLLHTAVFGGAGARPGRNFTVAGFDQWAAKKVLAAREQDQKAIKDLFKTVEYVALLVGTFTGGLGRIVATGVAIGADAFMAGRDIVEADRLQQAARSTPLQGTALMSKVQADSKKSEAIARMVQAMTAALMAAAPAAAAALRSARLAALVPEAATLARLRALAKDDVALERLLRKAGSAETAEAVLTKTGNVARAIEVLESRELFRQRFQERYSKDIADIRRLKGEAPELAAIPDEELVALRGYTAEDYDVINRALRAEHAEAELARLRPYIDNVKSGMERFPEFKGVVSRTESNTHAMYVEGETITQRGFTSTCGPTGKVTKQISGNTSVEIESLTGRDIRQVSAHPAEAEVLFAPGRKFLVVSKKQPLPGVAWYKVRLRELP